MPNWCYNNLEIYDKDPNTIKDILKHISKGRWKNKLITFNKLVKMPPSYSKDDRWYDWRVANRWTKRDASVWSIDIKENSISAFFDTARAPPTYWFSALCDKFPTAEIQLHYEEPSMRFMWRLESIWDWLCNDIDLPYEDQCEECEDRSSDVTYIEDEQMYLCLKCQSKSKT